MISDGGKRTGELKKTSVDAVQPDKWRGKKVLKAGQKLPDLWDDVRLTNIALK